MSAWQHPGNISSKKFNTTGLPWGGRVLLEAAEVPTLTVEDFRLVCAWCDTEMRAPRRRSENPPESHGLCVDCAVRMGAPAHLVMADYASL